MKSWIIVIVLLGAALAQSDEKKLWESQAVDFVSSFLGESSRLGTDNLNYYCLGSSQRKAGSDLGAVTYYTQVRAVRVSAETRRVTAIVSTKLPGGQTVNGQWTFSVSVGSAAIPTPYGFCMKKVSSAG